MQNDIERSKWTNYFRDFNRRNLTRPTKLETFGELGAQQEERYLPFSGISLEDSGKDAPRIEIMLGGGAPADPRHLTHTITHVTRIAVKRGDERDEAMEIEASDGTKTLLSFEALAELVAD
jgi:Family of unknown function (DUF5335)